MIAFIVWELNMRFKGWPGQQRFLPHSLWATAHHAEGMAAILADGGDAPRWVGVSVHVIDDINARRVNASGQGWKPPLPRLPREARPGCAAQRAHLGRRGDCLRIRRRRGVR